SPQQALRALPGHRYMTDHLPRKHLDLVAGAHNSMRKILFLASAQERIERTCFVQSPSSVEGTSTVTGARGRSTSTRTVVLSGIGNHPLPSAVEVAALSGDHAQGRVG